ncbi:Auxin-responsive GH3 family protein [Klebsormidium nitens]|uniref:Auxin-responsive GH3 family protein n=1 Tax=Klebsormidium nitens TaxID=105231 RepID=A0A0U9HLX3_KLENI|nr:Auxin-responsive GH3 family protein [Klebsormidium nitens]|eukprot:GAQ85453.1 Auxin-responsive GH3 family protein [Klebsormidium nitens]
MYCHLLCGLAGRERVTALRANFLIHILSGVQFLEKHWQSLVSDLRNGTVNPDMVPESALRSAVEKKVRAQPEGASALEAEFRRGFDGILPRVFPAVYSVQAVCTGSMLQYVPLMEKFAGPSVQLLTPFYAASEPSTIGVCLDLKTHPRDVAYTIIPRAVFWEFIPLDQAEGDEPVTKLLHELEEARSYELVLTNVSGLYRYGLEDVVKVTGFWHGLPQVQYEYRRGMLTITAKPEKVTEKDLAVAIGEMEKWLPAESGRVLDYTVAIDTEADPERYSVFVEVNGNEETVMEEILGACADAFDASLQKNPDYVHYRLRAQIGTAEICLVKRGAFDEFRAWKVEKGTDTAQYKVPRCLKTPEQQAVFRTRLLRSSAKDCHWFKLN